MIRLKLILSRLGASQADLAARLDVSRAKVAQWLNYDHWPVRTDSAELRATVTAWLTELGAGKDDLAAWWQPVVDTDVRRLIGPGRGRGRRAGVRDITQAGDSAGQTEDVIMLLRGQKLSETAKRSWGLFRDPFRGEIREHADLFITPDMRYCREAIWQTALHGGMTAIVGESGSGKTTLREDLHERIKTSGEPIVAIEPYVLDMQERVGRRPTMTSRDIAAAIVHKLDPHASVRQDAQARFRQVHSLLAESRKVGNRHLLVIEEAHDLPTQTLRHLKRYLELKDGFSSLLSVVLLGQPELGYRLSELDASVREIVQRCEVVTLEPLDSHLPEYLGHKLGQVGKSLPEILDDTAIEAIRARLTIDAGRGRATTAPVSLVYPLAVQNLLAAAMNKAAELGLPVVTADVVQEV